MNEDSMIDYLSAHPFFSGIDNDDLGFLARNTNETPLEKNEILFRQGEPADKFYLVRSGRISVYIPAISGPPLEIQNLGMGEILGWSWLISPYRWNFQAKAEDTSVLFEFDGQAILERCEQNPKFGYELLKRFAALMAERLSAARQTMMDSWNPPGFA